MRSIRCNPLQLSIAATSCVGLVRGHRLSVHRRSFSGSVSRSSGGDGAARATEPPNAAGNPVARPQGKHTTAADHVGVQACMQHALAIDEAAALDLISRGSRGASSFLHLAGTQAWIGYLTRLAGRDTTTVMAILHKQPRLLSYPFDEQRLAQLQHHLQQTLSIDPSQLLLMVTRQPWLLLITPDTVAAASHFLLARFDGDTAAVRKAVVMKPVLLMCSTCALQATLQWLTETLGTPPAAALRILPHVAGLSIASTLETWRLWFRGEGLSAAEVLSLACGAPTLLSLEITGRLAHLKLQYWTKQLSYSLSDLTLVPVFLTCGMARIASRHSALRHLRDATPSHTRFLHALISGGGSATANFGPTFYATFVKQHSVGRDSVQDLLMPLSACLSQLSLQAEWEAELLSHPIVAAAETSARKHATLYAALHSIQQRDWALSNAGRGWLADEAVAKAADLTARATKGVVVVTQQPRGAPYGAPSDAPSEAVHAALFELARPTVSADVGARGPE